jgi:hypothetical protein
LDSWRFRNARLVAQNSLDFFGISIFEYGHVTRNTATKR